jgi:hypothetical protein
MTFCEWMTVARLIKKFAAFLRNPKIPQHVNGKSIIGFYS